MKKRAYMLVTLGCFRNEVESDLVRSSLSQLGMEETGAIEDAELIVVNTCGFISDACDEGIDTILELDATRGGGPGRPPILVLGCMAQRYGARLAEEMPEIDGLLGSDWSGPLAGAVADLLEGRHVVSTPGAPGLRDVPRTVDSSESPTLFIRVADGCDRGCRFCSIPSIRGGYSSRSPESVCEEVRRLAEGRPREVILLAQDLTSYGCDLADGTDLPLLVRRLVSLEEVHWLRLLYLQPEGVTGALLDEVARSPKVCRYFDIPFQHASSSVLRRMGRPGGYGENMELVKAVRSRFPEAALRTTMMVGYPGETEEEFGELLRFVEEARFDWMGAFIFSPEEGTAAESLGGTVTVEEGVSRYNMLIEAQEKVEESGLRRFEGRRLKVVVEGASELDGYDLVGRSYREAPVVDGVIHLKRGTGAPPPETAGGFSWAKITGSEGLDLAGEIS